MVCPKCGRDIPEGANFCPGCGETSGVGGEKSQTTSSYNVLSIVGLVVSCVSLLYNFFGLMGIAGVILSVIGYRQIQKNGERGKPLALIGIILGGVSTLLTLIALVYMSKAMGVLNGVIQTFSAVH